MSSSLIRVAIFASVAQSVEQRTENPRVVGSIPTGGTSDRFSVAYADLAHLVERDLAKVEVAGSSPVIRSNKKEGRASLGPLFCCRVLRGQAFRTVRGENDEQPVTATKLEQIAVASNRAGLIRDPQRVKSCRFAKQMKAFSRAEHPQSFHKPPTRSKFPDSLRKCRSLSP